MAGLEGALPSSLAERLDRLAPDQRAAATAAPGPVLCVAPAGSGKTTTLVARVAWLVGAAGTDPAGIAAITFNTRAAEELRARLDPALAPLGIAAGSVRVRTFHALGLEILRDARTCSELRARDAVLRHACPVYFTPTFKLVQQLLVAKRELRLDKLLKKLDRFSAIIIDDLGYVQQSREEMEVLFTFLAERYERRSVLVSSNLVFSKWDQIFKDSMTTMAAVDRLVHHAIILEFDGESLRVSRPKEKGGG